MNSLTNTPFRWFGGKWEMVKWLVPLLPRGRTFVVTHCGAGSPIWQVDPYPVEVINDINKNLVEFFRACRERPVELAMEFLLTPYSRAAFLNDPRWIVVARQSMSGQWGKAWSHCVEHSRRGMSSSVSAWLNLPQTVIEIAARLGTVQIECMDAVELIKHYDRLGTVFYLDPPYCGITGSYEHDYTLEQHAELLSVLQRVAGKACLSGYRCPLYDRELAGWRRVDQVVTCRSNNATTNVKRTESAWMNYRYDDSRIIFPRRAR